MGDLPLGLKVKGRRERRVRARPQDEDRRLRLLDLDAKQPQERLISQALAACIESIGSVANPSPAVMDRLVLSDRHALIHGLLLDRGDGELTTAAKCSGCSNQLELSLDLGAIELPRLPRSGSIKLDGQPGNSPMILHFPTALDLEEASDELTLAARCLGCEPEEARPWLSTVEQVLSQFDPLGHLEISGHCPDCGGEVTAELDLPSFWLARLRGDSNSLLEEIHLLAVSYHWTESEILSLPVSRRQAYLEMCRASWAEPDDTLEPALQASKYY